MSENKLKCFKLENVSVVILAQTHNPSIINIDFLKNNGIIDDGWELQRAVPAISSPALALLHFENDIHWQVNHDNLTIQENCKDSSKHTNLVYECAKKYVQALRHIPYNAIGMNWNFSKEQDQNVPMKDRFLCGDEWKKDIELSTLAFKVPPAWSLALQEQGNKNLLNCNHHTDVASEEDKVEKMCSVIGKVEEHKKRLTEHIKKYFEDDLI